MKPGFALSLSSDGIVLFHRAAGGWRNVGHVTLDTPDLPGALADLRSKGQRIEAAGSCKLIIPNDQIRYLSIDTGDISPEERHAAARAALEGATPYAVDELAFDCSVDGAVTHVAAVAHETLAEAEAFALDNGFTPASFVAIPGDMNFLGEPFFGQAPSFVNQTVEADGIAVVDIGPVEEPAAIPQTPEQVPAAPELEPTKKKSANPQTTPEEKLSPASSSDRDASAEKGAEKGKDTTKDTAEDEAAPIAGFSSRRGKARSSAATKATAGNDVGREKASGAKGKDAGTKKDAAPKGKAKPKAASPEPKAPVDKHASPSAPPALKAERKLEAGTPADNKVLPAAPSVAKEPVSPAKSVANKTVAASKAVPTVPPADVPATKAASSPKKGSSTSPLFETPPRKKPRFMGLILTVGLLLFMAAVAAFAIWNPGNLLGTSPQSDETSPPSLSDPENIPIDQTPSETENTAEPAPPAVPPTEEAPDIAPIAPQVSVLADQPDPGVTPLSEPNADTAQPETGETPLTSTDTAVLDALRDQEFLPENEFSQEEAPSVAPVVPSELNQAAQYAATGIWHQVPEIAPVPGVIGLDDIYVASIDHTDLSQDAVALPPPPSEEADLNLDVVASPAVPGGNFELDARGLVTATPEGTLNPDGIMVYLGRPPVIPPPTPNRPDPEDEARIAQSERQARLQLARPRSRPENLAESAERARLGGLSRAELAKRRPRQRPENLKTEAETNQPVSAFAIANSVTPRARPANFANLVDRAIRNRQVATPASAPASVAPETVSPRLPSSASVARQATINNAINLRRINLIGVYGTASDRRALVRMSNGRYRKVQVGDRIDGGQVTAIGETQLKYQKRGSSVTLKLPGN